MQFYNDIMTKGVLLVGLFVSYSLTHLLTFDIYNISFGYWGISSGNSKESNTNIKFIYILKYI